MVFPEGHEPYAHCPDRSSTQVLRTLFAARSSRGRTSKRQSQQDTGKRQINRSIKRQTASQPQPRIANHSSAGLEAHSNHVRHADAADRFNTSAAHCRSIASHGLCVGWVQNAYCITAHATPLAIDQFHDIEIAQPPITYAECRSTKRNIPRPSNQTPALHNPAQQPQVPRRICRRLTQAVNEACLPAVFTADAPNGAAHAVCEVYCLVQQHQQCCCRSIHNWQQLPLHTAHPHSQACTAANQQQSSSHMRVAAASTTTHTHTQQR